MVEPEEGTRIIITMMKRRGIRQVRKSQAGFQVRQMEVLDPEVGLKKVLQTAIRKERMRKEVGQPPVQVILYLKPIQ